MMRLRQLVTCANNCLSELSHQMLNQSFYKCFILHLTVLILPDTLQQLLQRNKEDMEPTLCKQSFSGHTAQVVDLSRLSGVTADVHVGLLDSAYDESWLNLTLGPSRRAVAQYMRMHKEEAKEEAAGQSSTSDYGDRYKTVLSPLKKIVSGIPIQPSHSQNDSSGNHTLQQVNLPSISGITADFCGPLPETSDYEPSLILSLGPSHTWIDNEDKALVEPEEARKPEASTNEMVLTPLKRKVSETASLEPRTYCCNICGKEFKTHGALGGHMSRSRCYPNVAGQSSARKTEGPEKAQEITLIGPRKFYCKYCGKDFQTPQFLGGHASTCKQMWGAEKYHCRKCGKVFPSVNIGGHTRNCVAKAAGPNSARQLHLEDPAVAQAQSEKTDLPICDPEDAAVITQGHTACDSSDRDNTDPQD